MSPFYRLCHTCFRAALKLLASRWVVVGAGHLPSEGAGILISNHISYWDPGLVVAAIPRQVYFLSKSEMFDGGVVDQLFRWADVFPIQRDSPDIEAMRHALAVLQRGAIVGMFPKGTRAPENRHLPVRPGMILLAQRSGAPFIPCAIRGMDKLFRRKFPWCGRPRVTLAVGRPFFLSEVFPGEINADSRAVAVAAVMSRVETLLSTDEANV